LTRVFRNQALPGVTQTPPIGKGYGPGLFLTGRFFLKKIDHTPIIMGAETITGLGDGLEALWQQLLEGETAIKPVTRFSTEGCGASTWPAPRRPSSGRAPQWSGTAGPIPAA